MTEPPGDASEYGPDSDLTLRCSLCQAAVPPDAICCPACDADLRRPDATVGEYRRPPTPIARIVAAFILLLILGGLAGMVWLIVSGM
jgi:predicted amidophosphoribosyltransferase